jgi:hypothetical protein
MDQVPASSQGQFVEYLSQKRTDGLDGTDIDNWNYDDLIKLVDEFTSLYTITETMKCAIIKEGSESTGFLSSSYFYYIETTQALDGKIFLEQVLDIFFRMEFWLTLSDPGRIEKIRQIPRKSFVQESVKFTLPRSKLTLIYISEKSPKLHS